ncbi:autotransporter domain-containing protein [Akkermansia sp. N21116]|uniref:autotransporter family protein n=1 Tax=Akkermansia sp. N21116 TaxID=3040764 RepID=UPI00244EAED9|nr:autotransporter outer membrane beta-barrel domain-containing protein [Akkermansia sp. N21116]WPX40252.1 autotransporter domain-containing protein [Akkermansia sp. N21116]
MNIKYLPLLACAPFAYISDAQEVIDSLESWANAVNNNSGSNSYILATNLKTTSSVSLNNGDLLIDLEGHQITFGKTGSSVSDKLQWGIQIKESSTLTLMNGTLQGKYYDTIGKGIVTNHGKATLDRVTISDSVGTGYGLAIYNSDSFSSSMPELTLTDSVIKNNTMIFKGGRGFGAGLYNGASSGGNLLVQGALAHLDNVQFINNRNHGGFGGAIANGSTSDVGTLYIKNSLFWGNDAVEDMEYPNSNETSVGGGAIANMAGTVQIIDSDFYSNRSDLGGAIINRHILTIRADQKDVFFSNNTMHSHFGDEHNGADYIEGPNDIYLNSIFNFEEIPSNLHGYLNHNYLEAKEGRTIYFGGGIRGLNIRKSEDGTYYESVSSRDNVVWINKDGENGEKYAGAIYFAKTAIVQSVNITLYNGTMSVEDGDVFYSDRDRFDPIRDRTHLRHRNNFSLQGGKLDLSRLLTGTFSIENLLLTRGSVQFATMREHPLQSLIIGTSGWSAGNPETITFAVDCLGDYNKKYDYTLLDYVNENLTDDDLRHFELQVDHYGEGWALRVVDGDLVIHWEGDDEGTCPPCDLPHYPECPEVPTSPESSICPGLPEITSERKGELVENSLWGLDTNLNAMGNGALEQMNPYRMVAGPCRNLWVQGIGDFANQKSRGGIDGFDYAGGGYAAGMDGRLCGNAGFLGVAIGQIWGTMQSRDYASQIDQDTIMGTVYWGNILKATEDRAWLLKGALTFGQSENHLSAYHSDGSSSTGKWDNNGWLLQMEASYRLKIDETWTWAPFAGLEYAEGKRDAFRTRGNNTPDAIYEKSRLQKLTVPVGIQIDRLGSLWEKPWMNTLKLSYAFDVSRSNPDSLATMEGFRPWKVGSADPSRHAFRADFNTMLDLNDKWRVFAGYLLEVRGSGVYHQINAGVSLGF